MGMLPIIIERHLRKLHPKIWCFKDNTELVVKEDVESIFIKLIQTGRKNNFFTRCIIRGYEGIILAMF